jgi:hypothetical protein
MDLSNLDNDVGITLWVPDIAIPGIDYEDGPAQRLDKLDHKEYQLGLQERRLQYEFY